MILRAAYLSITPLVSDKTEITDPPSILPNIKLYQIYRDMKTILRGRGEKSSSSEVVKSLVFRVDIYLITLFYDSRQIIFIHFMALVEICAAQNK